MRVILQGFKCYQTQRIFTFSDCSLLQGRSGSGKSTIIRAILWCLFGGNKRVYGFKGTSSQVVETFVILELSECNNITIRRTPKNIEIFVLQGGNHVLLCQGTEAESYICGNIGSESLFNACASIQQNSRCTLITASSQEKAELLHKLTFGEQGGIDINENPQTYISQIEYKLRLMGDEVSKWKVCVNQMMIRYNLNCQNNAESLTLWTTGRDPDVNIEKKLEEIAKKMEDISIMITKRQEYDFQISEMKERTKVLQEKLKLPVGDIQIMESTRDKLHTILVERKSQSDLMYEYQELNKMLEPMRGVLELSKVDQEFTMKMLAEEIYEYNRGVEIALKQGFEFTSEDRQAFLDKLDRDISYVKEYPILFSEWEKECSILKEECDLFNKKAYEEWNEIVNKIRSEELEYNKEVATITSENNRLMEMHNEYKRINELLKPLQWVYDLSDRHVKKEELKLKIDEHETNKSLIYKYNVSNVEDHIQGLEEIKLYIQNYETALESWKAQVATIREEYESKKAEWKNECDIIREENSNNEKIAYRIEEENKMKQFRYDSYIKRLNERIKLEELYKSQYGKYQEMVHNHNTHLTEVTEKYNKINESLIEDSKWWKSLYAGKDVTLSDLDMITTQITIAMNQLTCPNCSVKLQMKDGKTLTRFETQIMEQIPYAEQLEKIAHLRKLVIESTRLKMEVQELSRKSFIEPSKPVISDEPEEILDLTPPHIFIKKILPMEPIEPKYPPEPIKLNKDIGSIDEEISQVKKITTMNNDTALLKQDYANFAKAEEYEPFRYRLSQLMDYETLKIKELPSKRDFILPKQPVVKLPILPPEIEKPSLSLSELTSKKNSVQSITFPKIPIQEVKSQYDLFKRIPDCENNWRRLCELKPIIENLKLEDDTQSLQCQYDSLIKDIDAYKRDEYAYNNMQEQIRDLEIKLAMQTSPCKESIEELKTSSIVWETQKSQYFRLKKAGEDYTAIINEYQEMSRYENHLKALIEKETNISQVLALVKELESQAVEDTVLAINNEANKILEYIFDEHIRIQLKTHKELKTKDATKLQVNLVISFGGCDDLVPSDLSGGEQDRISLALTLAMAKVSDSPFLLLDEVMSSIDNTLRGKCIKTIRSMFPNKTVINVCHEAVAGHYDSIIDLCCEL